ncbi:hypothetical protein O181_044301 [Austropuccinia psidii MF-1]|uniref:Uncharacterized protein n=1 Tax=Austropuccinia psidii MF-1 TaxID=1389203 RepID=A0A9Q3DI76_9BASI|nr:hypothetical protein [Austropuccinia psidii MF-1]
MSPSPAHSKPAPSQLASLMNPATDPPKEENHMILQEIYKSEPGFLTQSQNDNQLNTLAIILQKLENLEKRETNISLPKNLETLITQLNSRIEKSEGKKLKIDKVINELLTKIINSNKKQHISNF